MKAGLFLFLYLNILSSPGLASGPDLYSRLLNTKKMIMKKFMLLVLLTGSLPAFAQDSTKVEQYCRLIAFNRLLSNKVSIDVDFGDERKLFTDNRMRDEETGRLKKFNTIVDALNYLGSQGWTLVNAFPAPDGTNNSTYHYYFKKGFRKEDLH